MRSGTCNACRSPISARKYTYMYKYIWSFDMLLFFQMSLRCQVTVIYRFVSCSFMMFFRPLKRSVAWYALFTCTEAWNLECLHAPPLKHIQLYDFTHVCTCNGMWRCTILFSFETNHHIDWNPSKWLKCQLTVTYRFVSFSFMMFLLLWKRSVAWYALFTCTEAETWNACMPPH